MKIISLDNSNYNKATKKKIIITDQHLKYALQQT